MTILEKIVKVAKLEEAAENCTDQNCNSIMEILLRKANRDNNVAATLMNIYLECIHEPTGKPVGLIFKINLIGTTCKTDRISLALSE